MCFSASVSFGAGVLLTGGGIYAMKQAESPKVLPFASTPLLFGLQQFSEGLFWITAPDPAMKLWTDTAMYLFLTFAFVVWPILVPIAIWLMEPDKKRKKWMSYTMISGIAVGLYMLGSLIFTDVHAEIVGLHILYTFPIPFRDPVLWVYVASMLIPLGISSYKGMKLLGGTMFLSLIYSTILYFDFVISVWCFFAAVLSIIVVFVLVTNKSRFSKLAAA